MEKDNIPLADGSKTPPLECQRTARRILIVEDEPSIRTVNSRVLTASGYDVDAVEDGAAAWENLQHNRYDLLITDNSMPKLTGVELINMLREARMSIPIIMATAAFPKEGFIPAPSVPLPAMLLKPYSIGELLGTVKKVLCTGLPLVMLQLFLTSAIHAQDIKQPRELAQQSLDVPGWPSAVTISVHGKCEFSEDGVTFSKLEKGHLLEQGSMIRTSEDGRTDLFFRRTGVTVRLQASSEIKLEKMSVTAKDGLPEVHTLLDLRAGRIFTVVRSEVVGSTLEIRNAAGRSVVDGSGVGRYIITADGTHVSAIGSVIPLKVIGENGITVIAAGEQFSKADGKMLPASPSLWVKDLIELDELRASTENPDADQAPSKP